MAAPSRERIAIKKQLEDKREAVHALIDKRMNMKREIAEISALIRTHEEFIADYVAILNDTKSSRRQKTETAGDGK